MSTIITGPLKINGVISTDKSVLQNLNNLATASGCFLTFDINQGKWAVIINKTGSSVASFNDSNIVGNITVSETGVSDLYNSVSVEFPHPDIRERTDFVDITIPSGDRFPNEIDNNLDMQIDCINDPIQAQYLGSIELKQTRLNKIVTFNADYTSLGLKAGDLIDVTSSQYDFSSKVFRIIKIEENDEDTIGLTITALEYSEDIYDDSGLIRSERTPVTGILLKEQNEDIQESDDVDTGNQMVRLLAANAGALLLRKLFDRILGTNKFGPTTEEAEAIDKLLSNFKKPSLSTITMPDNVCEGEVINITAASTCANTCFLDIPDFDYDYEITGIFEEDIASMTINGASVPVSLTGKVTVSGGSGTMAITTADTAGSTSSQTMSITIGGVSDSCIIYDVLDYTFATVANADSVTEGASITFTVNTTNVPDATVIPYAITGPATSRVSSALTGNLTINSNTASVVINTIDDGTYTGTQALTFTITPTVPTNPCHGTWDFTAVVSLLDNDVAPPPVPDDTTCEYVLVPIVWCAVYDGTDNQMKSATVRRFAYLPVAQAGEATVSVPTAITVTKGNPSTIAVSSSVNVASSSSLGGMPIQVIRTFNSVQPSGLITGSSVSTVYGYLL